LAFVFAIAAYDLLGVDRDSREVDRARGRRSHSVSAPAGEVGPLSQTQVGHDHKPRSGFIRRRDDRTLDMTRARSQYFSSVKAIATVVSDQPEAMVVIGIPNAKQLPLSHVVSDSRQLILLAIPGDERDGVGVTLKQSPQRQAPEADLSQDVGQQDSTEPFAAELPRQRSR
jgi:hypothetical protein